MKINEINENQWKSMKIIDFHGTLCSWGGKNNENFIRTEKNREVAFLFSLRKHDSASKSRIPNGATAQKTRRVMLKNLIFQHLL